MRAKDDWDIDRREQNLRRDQWSCHARADQKRATEFQFKFFCTDVGKVWEQDQVASGDERLRDAQSSIEGEVIESERFGAEQRTDQQLVGVQSSSGQHLGDQYGRAKTGEGDDRCWSNGSVGRPGKRPACEH